MVCTRLGLMPPEPPRATTRAREYCGGAVERSATTRASALLPPWKRPTATVRRWSWVLVSWTLMELVAAAFTPPDAPGITTTPPQALDTPLIASPGALTTKSSLASPVTSPEATDQP